MRLWLVVEVVTGEAGSGEVMQVSEVEGPPGVVELVRVLETDVAAGSAVLGVSGLAPENVLRDPGLDGDGQATHAAADSGETSGVHADVCQSRANPLGYVGSGGLGYGGGRGCALVRVGG